MTPDCGMCPLPIIGPSSICAGCREKLIAYGESVGIHTPTADSTGRAVTSALMDALDTAGKANSPKAIAALADARKMGWIK